MSSRTWGSPARRGFLADLAQLVYLGWLDRSTRDAEFRLAGRGLGEFLSELVLAASARLPGVDR